MLVLRRYVELPPHTASDFDHGDVYRPSGWVFVAHTAEGTVEVIDGERAAYMATIPGCPQGSGVLCAQEDGLIFAAARGAGVVLVIDAKSNEVRRIVSGG